MTPGDAALRYAAHSWPVFPCHEEGLRRKQPRTPNGFHNASVDPQTIRAWWSAWPEALVGVPTGSASGVVVLDIDCKRPDADGYESLEDLGHSILPDTPMVHTPSGGVHVYFANPERLLRNSTNEIGPGIDIRGGGGYVIVPSPGSGYRWDPLLNFETIAPALAPEWLWPVKLSRPARAEPIRPVVGLDPYGMAAIERACDAIAFAPDGQQERTLNAECYSIGTLAGAGALPAEIALRALLKAANAMPDYNPHLPWRAEEIDLKVRRAFKHGMANPREARRVVA
jgi:hypothetical protein